MTTEERKEKFDEYYFSDLGMCGCGSPDDVKNFLYALLSNHISDGDYETKAAIRTEIIKNTDADTIFEIVFHMFENAGFLEHGSSVYGSWLTDKGKEFLELLKEFKDEE